MRAALFLGSALYAPLARAQVSVPDAPPAERVSELELFELDKSLTDQTSVASAQVRSVRESPGVVTVIDREEIQRLGARDLSDILQHIPGFAVALDTKGILTVGFRGLWGQEGKVLLLIDGQELNDGLYGTLQLYGHIPVNQIRSLQIIRGPGSVIYGGHAGLAVINVITDGPELDGARATATYGQTARQLGRANLELGYGKTYASGVGVSLSAYGGVANLAEGVYRANSGATYRMTDGNNQTQPLQVNAGFVYRDLHLRFIYDRYQVRERDDTGKPLPAPVHNDFTNFLGEARYSLQLSDKLRLEPSLQVRYQIPWNNPDVSDLALYRDKRFERYTARLRADYAILEKLNLLVGAEGSLDRGHVAKAVLVPLEQQYNGRPDVSYFTVAGFGELSFDNPIANIVAGARFEHHSLFGGSFVPRIALTHAFERVHLKALYSQAYRNPDLESLNLNPNLKPERISSFEAEAGYQVVSSLYVGANAFALRVNGPIVYSVDDNGLASYQNQHRLDTRGVEAVARLKLERFQANASYAFYLAVDNQSVPTYAGPRGTTELLALPAHKVAVDASFRIAPELRITVNTLFLSRRWYAPLLDTQSIPGRAALPNAFLLDLVLVKEHLFTPGLDASLGLYNALGRSFSYAQGYEGLHAPIPAQSRELMLKLSYALPL